MWVLLLLFCLASCATGSGGAGAVGGAIRTNVRRRKAVEANDWLQLVTVMQNFTQTLEVSQPLREFAADEVRSYQRLMAGYTPQLGAQVGASEIVTACHVLGQEVASVHGLDSTQTMTQKHILRISFRMEYETRFGHAVEEYPALFEGHLDSDLDGSLQDMRALSLPVEAVMNVARVGDMAVATEMLPRPPTTDPTAAPTASPSKAPSGAPTGAPTRSPIVASTGAADGGSPIDETNANVRRAYSVPSMMILYGSNLLDANATRTWTEITQDRIQTEAAAALDGRGDGLAVTVSLDKQEALESQTEMLRRRRMESVPPPRLRIDFTTNIAFRSIKDGWDPNEMVSSCFETLEQEEEYMASLRTADTAAFEGLEGMAMEVAGELVTEPPEPEEATVLQSADNSDEDDGNGDSAVPAVAGAALGVIALLLLVTGVLIARNRRRRKAVPKIIEIDRPAVGPVGDEEDSNNTADSHEDEEVVEEEEEEDAIYNSISAVAPPGKLGLVIANPRGDVPVVLQMKEDSVMQGRVRVGDLLLMVDEVDCRRMSSSEVSDAITERSQAPARTLVLLREQ